MDELRIQPFVFSWRGQFEQTCRTESALARVLGHVTVINSDDNNTRRGWNNVGHDAFFGDQFRRALELFDGDVLFHVQGDATYNNWSQLVTDARTCLRKYKAGIYAPNIENTWWTPEHADILSLQVDDPHISVCACVDETVWFIRAEVIQEMLNRKVDFSQNTMGWGWDLVLCSLSFLIKRRVIRDYRHTINHPRGTGYDVALARREMDLLFQGLDEDIRECIRFIHGDRERIVKYFQ